GRVGERGEGVVGRGGGSLGGFGVVREGGFQVNCDGRRFSDESLGYSEQAAEVLRQPDGLAFDIFDERIAGVARQFPDFRNAESAGAMLRADSPADLAARIGVPATHLIDELTHAARPAAAGHRDGFGRGLPGVSPLAPPYPAVKVTGALFHTQGGLAVTLDGRVRRADGSPFPNLFAAGGAAVGLSGSSAKGYLSGNGLLTATVLGRIAGSVAARTRAADLA